MTTGLIQWNLIQCTWRSDSMSYRHNFCASKNSHKINGNNIQQIQGILKWIDSRSKEGVKFANVWLFNVFEGMNSSSDLKFWFRSRARQRRVTIPQRNSVLNRGTVLRNRPLHLPKYNCFGEQNTNCVQCKEHRSEKCKSPNHNIKSLTNSEHSYIESFMKGATFSERLQKSITEK